MDQPEGGREGWAAGARTAALSAEPSPILPSATALRRLFEDSPVGIGTMRPDGREATANPALRTMLGLGPADDPTGPLLAIARPGGDPETARSFSTDVGERVVVSHYERVMPGRIGATWLDVTITHAAESPAAAAAAVCGAPGCGWVLVQVVDISARKRIEQELGEAERLLRRMSDESPAPIYIYDLRGGARVAAGRGLFELLGHHAEELEDLGPDLLAALAHPDDIARIPEPAVRAAGLADGEPYEYDIRLQARDGSWRTLQMREVVFSRHSDGSPAQLLGVAVDVTAERTARDREAVLARQRDEATRQLAKLSEAAPGMLYVFRRDAEGRYSIPFASRSALDLYGLTPEQLRHDASVLIETIVPEDRERVVAAIERSAARLTAWHEEFRIQRRDGEVRWLMAASQPEIHEDGSIVWHGFNTDITERKRAEAAQRQFELRLQQTQRLESLGVLAGGIAHDFNNLLTAILGNAELAMLDLAEDAPGRGPLSEVTTAAQRASELCRQMLAYSGRGKLVEADLDLGAMVEEMGRMLRVSIPKKVELRIHAEPSLPVVRGDASQLRQVLMNLILNASDAIGGACGAVDVRLAPATLAGPTDIAWLPEPPAPGRYVRIEVVDDGCGMSEATLARIFEPFYTTKFTGRGLGLSAVLGIVRGHRGALAVESRRGIGSTFQIVLPVAPAATPERIDPGRPDAPTWRGSGRILLVDDEDSVRILGERVLEKLGFTVDLAADGEEAVALVRKGAEYRVILLDLTMPGMDGAETLAALRSAGCKAPVLLSSGYSETEVQSHFADRELAGILHKPFSVSDLVTRLRALL